MNYLTRARKKILRVYWYCYSRYTSTRIFYYLNYYIGRAYNYIVFEKSIKPNSHSIRHILIIYSKNHFNPEDSTELHYSTSNLARNIHSVCKELARVTYVDQNEPIKNIGDVDLIIGIVCKNFKIYSKKYPLAKKILFLVNCHPLWRLKTLLKESRRLHKLFPNSEFVSPFTFLRLRGYVDQYLYIGNNFIRNTFIEYGIPKEKMVHIDSGVNLEILKPCTELRPQKFIHVIYPASHLGIRKGLFRVLDAWNIVERQGVNAQLSILGGADKFKKDIDRWVSIHPKTKYHGWIESNTETYRKLLQSSHVIVNPSFEEGQVGCVLEAMSVGAVPIISENCGIHIQNEVEGFILNTPENSSELADKIMLLSKNTILRDGMSQKSLDYVKSNHSWDNFKTRLSQIIRS